ncbi:MAG TPA: pyridoxal phosphate-dependent aminotransferase [Phycisphaerae bacterium]|nr:pyridoxal phosphate-dependent aminotransferase [Phycisphaerae bacterium]HNU44022.1 pyridoxal phosphate-dependent aminotransferase [Phycisphaerae bacterium]
MEYMQWAKTHRRVIYELTGSGVPALPIAELGATLDDVCLDSHADYYGRTDLTAAVAERYGLPPRQVLPVAGTSLANFLVLALAAELGPAVALERPLYEPLERAAGVLKLELVRLDRPAERGFAVDTEAVEQAARNGAKAVFLTNLHNPSGQYLSPDALRELAGCCRRLEALLIVDEVYLDGAHLTVGAPLWTAAGLAENVIVTSSLTKVYGLGGLRVGWVLAQPQWIERLKLLLDAVNPCNSAVSEALGVRAFARLAHLEERYRRYHAEGQRVYRAWLRDETTLNGYPNHGAVFECVRLPVGVLGVRLNELLMSRFDTQVVPGSFFGLDDHVRICTAVESEPLQEGLARVSQALRQLTA